MCQNFTLKPNSTYELKFTFAIDGPHAFSNLTCKLNNVILCSVVADKFGYPVEGAAQFNATQISNSVCFSANTSFKSTAPTYDTYVYGPALDNARLY